MDHGASNIISLVRFCRISALSKTLCATSRNAGFSHRLLLAHLYARILHARALIAHSLRARAPHCAPYLYLSWRTSSRRVARARRALLRRARCFALSMTWASRTRCRTLVYRVCVSPQSFAADRLFWSRCRTRTHLRGCSRSFTAALIIQRARTRARASFEQSPFSPLRLVTWSLPAFIIARWRSSLRVRTHRAFCGHVCIIVNIAVTYLRGGRGAYRWTCASKYQHTGILFTRKRASGWRAIIANSNI